MWNHSNKFPYKEEGVGQREQGGLATLDTWPSGYLTSWPFSWGQTDETVDVLRRLSAAAGKSIRGEINILYLYMRVRYIHMYMYIHIYLYVSVYIDRYLSWKWSNVSTWERQSQSYSSTSKASQKYRRTHTHAHTHGRRISLKFQHTRTHIKCIKKILRVNTKLYAAFPFAIDFVSQGKVA